MTAKVIWYSTKEEFNVDSVSKAEWSA